MSRVVVLDSACAFLHDAYEKAAEKHGWETNHRSRVPWSDVPSENKATMREAVAEFLDELGVPYHDVRRQGEGLL